MTFSDHIPEDFETAGNSSLGFIHTKNLMAAIEQEIVTKTTKKRLSDLEAAQEQIKYDIEECSVKQPE